MSDVMSYIVTAPAGLDLGVGHCPKGSTVYDPWLEESAGRLERLGHVASIGYVGSSEVPDADMPGVPSWARPAEAAPERHADLTPVEAASVEQLASALSARVVGDASAAASAADAILAAGETVVDAGPGVDGSAAAIAASVEAPAAVDDANVGSLVESSNVAAVLAYAAANPHQAAACLRYEKLGRRRVTLVRDLEALIAGSAS